MVDAKTIASWSTIPLALALIASLFGNIQPDATHYCESRQVKSYCFALTATRCYKNPEKTSWNVCTEGWKPITKDESNVKLPCTPVAVVSYTDIGKFYCDGIGEDAKCVRWEDLLGQLS